jgi:transposase InsO family protein
MVDTLASQKIGLEVTKPILIRDICKILRFVDANVVHDNISLGYELDELLGSFLREAAAHYQRFGVQLKQVMTDNGACFRSEVFAAACRQLALKHIFTRPYTPRTNGKAERFIQSSLREWAYAHIYPHSDVRTERLSRWIHRYNWHRPHASLGLKPPVSRLQLSQNNLLTLHS